MISGVLLDLASSRSKYILTCLVVAVVYYLSARLGLLLAFQNTNASPVWPPSGIALFFVLVFGYRIWPGILIGAFTANLVVFLAQPALSPGVTFAVSLAIAIGNTVESLAAQFFIRRLSKSLSIYDTATNVFKFVLATWFACSIGASIGPPAICTAQIASWTLFKNIWFTWWLGDAVGMIVITPLLLSWRDLDRSQWTSAKIAEVVVVFVLIWLSTSFAFGRWYLPGGTDYPIAFIVIPFLVWVALRFSQRETTTAVALVSTIAVWQTIHGGGAFVLRTTNESLLVLQSYIAILAVTIMVLGATVKERLNAKNVLEQEHNQLENRINERTAELSDANSMLSQQMEKLREAERALLEQQKLQGVLYRIALEASSASDLQQLYAAIHKSVSELINARNFYIALYDYATETVTFPYHVDDFDPDWKPQTRRKGLTEYLIRTGKPLLVNPETFQELVASGEVDVVISRRIDWLGVPLKDENGTFGMLGVHSYSGNVRFQQNDLALLSFVSQQVASAIRRKQTQEALQSSVEALKKSEEKYRLLTEHIPAITYIAEFGELGRWLYVSPKIEPTLGFTSNEWMKNPHLYWSQLHAEDRARVFAQEAESKRSGATYVCEYRMHARNGDIRWFHDEGVPLEGNVFQGFLLDITERKTIERLKDELTSIVAHELRSPLTSIIGSLGYLSSRNRSMDEQERKLIDIANKNSERMLRLINDLLDIDKIESGKMKFNLQPVDVMDAVEHAIEINQAYADQFEVKLAITQQLPGSFVMAERDRLTQVLTNLISNAAKFSPYHSTVEIRVQQIRNVIRISVVDHGTGIPEEFRDSVFQKFAQADTGSKKGSGLGLTISKAIVEKMGGDIGFESTASGTTFYFDLQPAGVVPV